MRRFKLCLKRLDLAVDSCDLIVVFFDCFFFGRALRSQIGGHPFVSVKLLQRTAVLIQIGIFGRFKHRNAHLHVHTLGFKLANVLKCLCNNRLKLGSLLFQLTFFLIERILLLGQLFRKRLQLSDLLSVRRTGFLLGLNGFLRSSQASLRSRDQILCIGNAVFRHTLTAFKLVATIGLLSDLCQKHFALSTAALGCLKQLFVLLLQSLQIIVCGLQIKRCMLKSFLRRRDLGTQLFGIVQPQTDVCALFVL